MRTPISMLAVLAVLALAACGKTETPAAPVATPAAAPVAAPVAPVATPASSGGTGVAECDDYLAKYEACLAAKVPESARAMLSQSLDATRASWSQVLATPGGKDALKTSCVAARDASRASLQAYGCTDF